MSRRFDRNWQFSVTDRLPYIAGTNDAAVELVSLEVHVLVTGLFAETTQIFRLYNPNQRVLEGELCLPLPDQAVVCGYAIDVEGQLVDGVVVPREEARRILEAEIRKGIDPGLVENVQGNVYRTRIYPLPIDGSRTVKIVYISPLTVEGSDAAYHLPLGHAEGVDDVKLVVEVSQTPVQPEIGGLGNLAFNEFESRWVARATLGPGTPGDDLQVRLPNLPDHFTAVERSGEQEFFCISSRITDPSPSTWVPERVAVLWDASGSRQSVDRDVALLEALAERWQAVTFDVRILRNVSDADVRSFEVTGGAAGELVEFLRGLPCDGGTYLADVDLGDLPHADDEAWLLFSDGLNTIGSGLPGGASCRVFTISSQAECDSALLSYVARRSGGTHLNLLRTDPTRAASAIATWTDTLRLADATGCDDVHVSVHAGRLTVVGRLTESTAHVQLTGPGAPADHLTVSADAATSGRNLARAWAGEQAQLLKLLGAAPEEIVAIGQRYGLVTHGTSLLVLESLDQYLEYDIEPPATLPAMRDQFREHRRSKQHDEETEARQQLERVLSLWKQRVAWWETDFGARRKARHRDEKAQAELAAAMGPGGAPPSPAMSMSYAEAPQRRMQASAPAMFEVDRMEAEFEDSYGGESVEPAPSGVGGAPVAKELGGASAQASIQIQPWSPDTPYLRAMKAAGTDQAYACYLENRREFARSPAFFLDCADFLLGADHRAQGLRVLSNLLELALDDPALLRMYAWRMQQAGELDPAIDVLERVLARRDDEPQSHRDLALALEQRWQRNGDAADAVRAMELLYAVVTRTWDRFPEIEVIALLELNRLIYLAEAAGIERPAEIDPRLVHRLDLDVRISMSWDADLTDVDLHVFEPTDEHAYYGHNQTEIGGLVSRDFREGYGPEEYVLRKAVPGGYTIKTHYYGSHQQTVTGACTVIVHVFTNYARPDEQRQVLTLRLEQASDQVVVGTVQIDGATEDAHSDAWRESFRALTRGMTVDEIVAAVGQPTRLQGSGETVLIYEPRAGVEIRVYAAPRLTSVQQVMDGAVLELV